MWDVRQRERERGLNHLRIPQGIRISILFIHSFIQKHLSTPYIKLVDGDSTMNKTDMIPALLSLHLGGEYKKQVNKLQIMASVLAMTARAWGRDKEDMHLLFKIWGREVLMDGKEPAI